ncbi:hypothetical protein M0R45_008693 [Rubus argutus]|uniref:HD-Zip IV C-terminal domain-containing protein n=1 Tax=Rubus argutus TaxID=59490 RepID=A0AAW1Y2G2_RUBAR
MEVKTNKRRGDPGKPPGLHRTAGCTVELISSHNRVFDYLRDIQNRPQWERSYVIFAPITPDVFQSMLYGVDQDIPLMPFGFSILPNVSGSILDGTLLTMVFQITVKNVSSKQAVEVVTQIVKEALQKIIEAVKLRSKRWMQGPASLVGYCS